MAFIQTKDVGALNIIQNILDSYHCWTYNLESLLKWICNKVAKIGSSLLKRAELELHIFFLTKFPFLFFFVWSSQQSHIFKFSFENNKNESNPICLSSQTMITKNSGLKVEAYKFFFKEIWKVFIYLVYFYLILSFPVTI